MTGSDVRSAAIASKVLARQEVLTVDLPKDLEREHFVFVLFGRSCKASQPHPRESTRSQCFHEVKILQAQLLRRRTQLLVSGVLCDMRGREGSFALLELRNERFLSFLLRIVVGGGPT